MKTVTTYLLLAALLCSTVVTSSGCTSSGPKGSSSWNMPWSKKDKPPKPYPNPVKMAVTWTPDTLVQTGRTPTRGFGGRLFFYDEKTRPVPVEGDLTVHAIAENADGSIGEVKRYHFTPEQFTQHFSQSDLGASYSIWIPWDAVGGEQMRISLVPSFRTVSGRMVQGEQALVGLPGRRSQVENIAKRPDPIDQMLAQRDTARSGLTTTTIPVRREGVPVQAGPPISTPSASTALTHAMAAQSGPATGTDFPVSSESFPVAGPSYPAVAMTPPAADKPEPRKPMRLGVSPASAELPLE